MRPTAGDTICGRVRIEAATPPFEGAHAFGAVLCATDLETDEPLWLTIVDGGFVPSAVDVSRFMAGANALVVMEHSALCPVVLVDREAEFCVIGCAARGNVRALSDVLEAGEAAPLVARTVVELARGLAYVHAAGRIHGALSPANVLMRNGGAPLLTQHGISDLCDAEQFAARTRKLGGDVVAPEVKRGGPFTAKIDVFAWGAIAAAMATGLDGADAAAAVTGDEAGCTPLLAVAKAALDPELQTRLPDGAELLRRLANPDPAIEVAPQDRASVAAMRELASRYLGELEALAAVRPLTPAAMRRAVVAEPPELAPRAGEMTVSDEPDPDPFSVDVARPRAPAADQEIRLSDDIVRIRRPDPAAMFDFGLGAPNPAAPPPPGMGMSMPRSGPSVSPPPGPLDTATPPDGPAVPRPTLPLGDPTPPPAVPTMPLRSAEPLPTGPPPMPEIPQLRAPRRAAPVELPPAPDTGPAAPTGGGHHGGDKPGASVNPPPERGAEPAATLEFEMAPKLREMPQPPGAPVPPVASAPQSAAPHVPAAAASVAAAGAPPPRAADSPGLGARASGLALGAGASGMSPGPAAGGAAASSSARVMHEDPALALDLPTAGASSASRSAGPEIKRVLRKPGKRGPPAALMAAVVVVVATVLAIGLTVPVAARRGGLANFLGMRAATAGSAQEADARTPEDVEGKTPPVPPVGACPSDMVRVEKRAEGLACIDAGEYPGLREVPRVAVALAEARTLCAERGRQLCTAAQWRRACRGPKGQRFPYGPAHKRGACNEARADGVGQNLSRSGARDGCVSAEGAFDLVGNVGEWVDGGSVLGGDANTRHPSCASKTHPRPSATSPSTGFRCCLTVALQ